jgi:cytochrome-b5 reductase
MLRFLASTAVGCGAGAAWSASSGASRRGDVESGLLATAACAPSAAAGGGTAAASSTAPALNPDEWTPHRLISSRFETHDTRRFIFALSNPEGKANLPIGSCVLVKYTDPSDGKDVIRPYTPVTNSTHKGVFELMIKRYPKSKMGHHIHTMRPGEDLLVKGPIVKFDYKPNKFDHVAMIAGGTGVAPMFQFVQGICDNPTDKTKLTLIYSNKSRNDMLLATELSEFQKGHPQFHMYVTLTQSTPFRWLGGIGHINRAMLTTFLPKPNEPKTVVLVCGPPSFMKAVSGDKDFSKGGMPEQGAVDGILKEMGYPASQVFKF